MLMMVAAIMCVAATAQERYEKRELIVGGDTLRYCALAPQQIEQGKSYPLVVFLHGAGERGEENLQRHGHALPQEGEDAEREGDVRGHGDCGAAFVFGAVAEC